MCAFLLKETLQQFSRREFLKLSGQALLSLFWIPFAAPPSYSEPRDLQQAAAHLGLGRILHNVVTLYDRPSFSGKLIKTLWRDLIFPITNVTVGDNEPSHNRVWYELSGEGFAHSGSVQPVEIKDNQPKLDLIPSGQLAEITVPFTDALWSPNRTHPIAYRLYYSTTHWVEGVKEDAKGNPWYRVPDDKWGFYYYVNARHMRLIPPEELTPLSPHVPAEAKRIEVHLEQQVVIAYENDVPVFMARTATGAKFSNGDFRTPTGRYMCNRKRPVRHMAAGDLAAPNSYDLPGVPWVCYLTESGISFHGTYWHNDFGKPRSHGCINLSSAAARWLYRWSMPWVPQHERLWKEQTGTRVDVI